MSQICLERSRGEWEHMMWRIHGDGMCPVTSKNVCPAGKPPAMDKWVSDHRTRP